MLERPTKLTSYRFDQLADQINQRVMPAEADVERYVGLEHLDPESLRIRRWGDPSEVESTKLRFEPGDIIFGKRRAYQRKVAVADTEGICSAHAMVLRAKPDTVLPEFLPFFMQSDLFMERALSISVGSLSPTINWKTLAKEEFLLPPIQEQARLVEAFSAAEDVLESARELESSLDRLYDSASLAAFAKPSRTGIKPSDWLPKGWRVELLGNLIADDAPICYGIVQVGDFTADGVPTLAIHNLSGDFIENIHRAPVEVERTYRRSRVTQGDVVISIKGTIGEIAVIPEHFTGNLSRELAKLRFDRSLIDPEFFIHLYASPSFRRYTSSLIVGSTRAELSIDTLRKMQVPLPPLDQQTRLVNELNEMKKRSREAETRFENAKQFSKKLAETAFAGVEVQ